LFFGARHDVLDHAAPFEFFDQVHNGRKARFFAWFFCGLWGRLAGAKGDGVVNRGSGFWVGGSKGLLR